jgi:hypothetical protein
MSARKSIEKSGLSEVVSKLALSHSEREIVDILARDHKFFTSQSAVHRFVSPLRAEVGERVKARVNDQVMEDLPDDLDQLNEIRDFYRTVYQDPEQRMCDRISAADKARAVIDTKLKYSGAGQPGKVEGGVVYIPMNGRDDGS